jgi:DNA-binding SARP family transcriptional activator/energy-coupling factor transporter ATP-binding protein EcfA2
MPGAPADERGLHIAFLGQPRFSFDGKPFPFTRPRALGLLAYLLLHRAAHLTRDAVAFTLWPDESESEARGILRRQLHLLTQLLPASAVPYIVAQEDTLRWNDDAPVWFDVDVFESTVNDGASSASAVELYRGDLLPAIFDDWIFPIRERLRRRYLDALDRLLIRARSARELPLAASYAGLILAHDPWREDAVRQAAAIRFESGDRAGALRVLAEFADRLREEMGVDPMPETVAAREALLRGAPIEIEERAVGTTAPARGFPFVGRGEELAHLTSAWKRAARQRGQLILVGGEAGIGKSRLVNELALVVEAQGGRVLRGTTSSPERATYQPIVEALREAIPFFATSGVRPVWLSALAALVPEVGVVRGDLPALPALEEGRERARLFEALIAAFNALARQRPLLLVIEDVHWAGAGTLAALEYIARRAVALPALVVATYRTEDGAEAGVRALRRRLQAENVIEHVALSGLPVEAIRQLALAIPALAGRTDELAPAIFAASEGNPLFAGELLRDRAESRESGAPPAGLQQTLEARCARLSESARTIAGIASVVGLAFDVDLVRGVAGWDENAVLAALAELLDRNLVRDIGRAGFAFAFTHHLIAATIYAGIAPATCRRWHDRVAVLSERIEADVSEAAATIAYHFDRAGKSEEAAARYLLAARRAFALFANDEALAAASRGLELAEDRRLRLELTALRESVNARRGERDSQRRDLDAFEQLAEELEDSAAAAEGVRRRAALAHAVGDLAQEAELLARYGRFAEGAGDVALQATALRAISQNQVAANRFEEAQQTALAALERYRALDDAEGEVESLCVLAEIAANYGEPGGVRDRLAAAGARAAEADNALLVARVLMSSSAAAIMRREFPEALRDAGAALERYREIGDREGEAEATSRVATALGMLQRIDEARSTFAQSAAIYQSIGNQLKYAYVLFNQTSSDIQVGLLDAAAAALTEALTIFRAHGDRRGYAVCRTNLSVVALQRGEPEEAKRFAELALADARELGLHLIEAAALSNLGNAERELGESAAALGHMQEAIAIRHRLGRPATFEELGDLALAQLEAGDLAAARVTADEVIARLPESPENTVWPHHCLWAAARVYRACGSEREARAALEEAAQLVRRQTEAMTDAQSRSAFAALSSVREIALACERDAWPLAAT